MKADNFETKSSSNSNTPKIKWLVLLAVATLLFFLGLVTQLYVFYVTAILLAFYVRRNGYNILFREYDQKLQEKRTRGEFLLAQMKNSLEENK